MCLLCGHSQAFARAREHATAPDSHCRDLHVHRRTATSPPSPRAWECRWAEQVWDYWLVYLTIVVAILVAVTNAIFLTKGMQENEALFMVSVTSPRMAAHGDAHTGDTRGTCTVGHTDWAGECV